MAERTKVIRYEPVPLPTGAAGTSNTEIAGSVHRWVSARPLRDLVAAFGGAAPGPDTATGALLGWLDRFSAAHWDFRRRHGQVERDEVPPPSFAPRTAESILASVTALGLVRPLAPPARRYDHLLVLGGLAPACLQRTGYAAHLVHSGAVEVGEVAALGSFRPLRPTEIVRADLDGCGYEMDALAVGLRLGFFGHETGVGVSGAGSGEPGAGSVAPGAGSDGPGAGSDGPGAGSGGPGVVESWSSPEAGGPASWAVRGFRAPDGLPLRVYAAPSGEPATRRANTADTYRFWAGQVRLTPGDRVLVVTSPSYVPFQHCDAVRMLRLDYGCAVDTVGFDATRLRGLPPAPVLAPDRYLQEIRSAIRSMESLFRALDPPGTA
ncbi:hypothetical protein ACI2K4_15750 [Micromonospora sp. NPDC050397]|uniref:hypothetical protein n=1 Tax=Micromonospora sp. NPDC050397 TaxID=3364279 RepID=UPI0038515FF8